MCCVKTEGNNKDMSLSLSGCNTVLELETLMFAPMRSQCRCFNNRHTLRDATVISVTLFAVTMGALFNGEGPCVDSLVTQTAELNDVFRDGKGGECAQLAASLEVVISEVSALREAPWGTSRATATSAPSPQEPPACPTNPR